MPVLSYFNPNFIFKRQPLAGILHAGLFCLVALFVWCFGAVALGILTALGFFAYIAVKKPFAILLLTMATIFLPASFDEFLGVDFPVTPTRVFGMLLIIPVIMHIYHNGWKPLFREAPFKWALILLFWGAFTDLIGYPEYLARYFIDTVPALIIFAAIIILVKNRQQLDKLLLVMLLASLVTAVSGFIIPDSGRMGGLTNNANTLARNCLVGVVLALYFWREADSKMKKAALIAATLVFLAAFGFAASRSASLGLIVAGAFIMRKFIKKPSVLITVFILGLVFVYFAPELFWKRLDTLSGLGRAVVTNDKTEHNYRLYMYRRGWELFLESPVYGWGSHSFPKVGGLYIRGHMMHSWYLAMLCEQGMIGLALYLAFFASIYKNIKTTINKVKISDILPTYIGALSLGLAVAGTFNIRPLNKVVFVIAGISVVIMKLALKNENQGKIRENPTNILLQ